MVTRCPLGQLGAWHWPLVGQSCSPEQVSVVAAPWPWCFFLGVELKLEMILLLCDVLTR